MGYSACVGYRIEMTLPEVRGPIDFAPIAPCFWGYNQAVILLTEKEEQLVETIRVLPPGTADQILLWATQLADLAAGQPVDWSDAWSDEDLRDATAASLRSLEESESRERSE